MNRWQTLRFALRRAVTLGLEPVALALDRPLTQPSVIHLRLTDRCNFRCEHCDVWRVRQHGHPPPAGGAAPRAHREGRLSEHELSTGQWLEVLEQLGAWLGPSSMHLSGGEVLLRPDFFTIAARAKALGFHVQLNTNGSLLDAAAARELVALQLDQVMISLYSRQAALHDRLRGFAGSYERALAGAKALLRERAARGARRPRLRFGYLLTRDNLAEVESFIRWAGELGARVMLQPLYENLFREHGRRWARAHPLWPGDDPQLSPLLARLIAQKRGGAPIDNSAHHLRTMARYFERGEPEGGPCDVGVTTLVVDPRGDASFCYLSERFGNVGETAVEELWRSAAARRRRGELRRCDKGCKILYCSRYHKRLGDRVGELGRRLRAEVGR